jgi:hypothetical protein
LLRQSSILLQLLLWLVGYPCHDGLLARIQTVLGDLVTLAQIVQFDLVCGLTMIKSDLDAASAFTSTREVVNVDRSVYDMATA